MANKLDPVEEWKKLRKCINLEHYIGPRAVEAIDKKIVGSKPPVVEIKEAAKDK